MGYLTRLQEDLGLSLYGDTLREIHIFLRENPSIPVEVWKTYLYFIYKVLFQCHYERAGPFPKEIEDFITKVKTQIADKERTLKS